MLSPELGEQARPQAQFHPTRPKSASGPNSEVGGRYRDVRFTSESRLKSDIAACPKGAKLGNGSRRKIALHCEPTRSEAVMSRHIVLAPMS
jgi:hypothetical protein